FLQQLRNLACASEVDRKITTLGQASVCGKFPDFFRQQLRADRVRDWLLHLKRKLRSQGRRPRSFRLAATRKKIRAPSQIFSGLAIVMDGGDGLVWNRA